jgi:hypothetical protein
MCQRDKDMLWLSDMLDHLRHCQRQLSWTDDTETIEILTDAMLRDLERCRRLCEAMTGQSSLQHSAV